MIGSIYEKYGNADVSTMVARSDFRACVLSAVRRKIIKIILDQEYFKFVQLPYLLAYANMMPFFEMVLILADAGKVCFQAVLTP